MLNAKQVSCWNDSIGLDSNVLQTSVMCKTSLYATKGMGQKSTTTTKSPDVINQNQQNTRKWRFRLVLVHKLHTICTDVSVIMVIFPCSIWVDITTSRHHITHSFALN